MLARGAFLNPVLYFLLRNTTIAGYVLFIPANLLPITITTSLFGTQPDTIMSGVAYFWHEGAYDLAIIIFTASIFVPLLKLLSLTFLAWSAQRRMTWESQQRTRLTPATVNKSLVHLERIGIVGQVTNRQRGRVFSYRRYVEELTAELEEPA